MFDFPPQSAPEPVKSNHVLPESTMLVILGGVALLSTLYLIATHQAVEANPFMRFFLQMGGPIGVIIAKALLLAVPIALAEWARKKHEDFVKKALKIGVAAYAILLLLAYLGRIGMVFSRVLNG